MRGLLLFGDPQLNVASFRKILEELMSLIKNTKKFSNNNWAVAGAIFVLFSFLCFFIFDNSIRCLERSTHVCTSPTLPYRYFFLHLLQFFWSSACFTWDTWLRLGFFPLCVDFSLVLKFYCISLIIISGCHRWNSPYKRCKFTFM